MIGGHVVLDLQEQLKKNLNENLSRLEKLVNIDSGSYCPDGIRAVRQELQSWLEGMGFRSVLHSVDPERELLVSQLRFGEGPKIVILGHLDTVWPAGTASDWKFGVENGYATGPGVGDMKGGLVMALSAVQALLDGYPLRRGSIKWVLVPDEELGSVRSRGLIEEEVTGADAVLVLEPGRPENSVVVARGAVGAMQVKAKGVTAHCAVNYQDGVSAIKALATVVPALEKLSVVEEGVFVNVGLFNGGSARQVVPEDANLWIDVRAPEQAVAERVVSDIKKITQSHGVGKVRVEIIGGLTRPAFMKGINAHLLEWVIEDARRLGEELKGVSTPAGSDGCFSAAMGIPTIDGLGPVTWDVCSKRERIRVDSLVMRGAIFGALVTRCLETIKAATS